MTYILYHGDCFDGLAAAYSASLFVGDPKTYIPCTYGAPIPDLKQFDHATVYLLDFSFPREVMLEINKRASTFRVLDHHKTAQASCEGLSFCTFDMERSGAGLTWDFFTGGSRRPALINYIEDRDLWRFKLPNSHEIHAWVASFPKDITLYRWLSNQLEGNFGMCALEGSAILRYQNAKIEEFCTEARFTDIGGHSVPTINVPYQFGSDACVRLCELYPAAPFAAYFCTMKGGFTKFGLRGRETDDFDVSEVAKTYGGGGHRKAAGFEITSSSTISL